MSGAGQWVFRDRDGRELRIVWSRSGKSAGVNIALRAPWRFAQVALYPDQLALLAEFLRREPPVGRAAHADGDDKLELDDRDRAGARLQVAWNRQGSRITVSMTPWWQGDPPVVTLNADEIAKVAAFVEAGRP